MRIAPGDFRIGVRYCKALFTLRQHERALQKLPVEMVAHHLFHELLELGQKGCGGNGNELRAKLSELHSVLKGDRGNEALFGGLVEFASYVSRHPSLCDVAAMREWSEAISEFFKGQPRFAVLV